MCVCVCVVCVHAHTCVFLFHAFWFALFVCVSNISLPLKTRHVYYLHREWLSLSHYLVAATHYLCVLYTLLGLWSLYTYDMAASQTCCLYSRKRVIPSDTELLDDNINAAKRKRWQSPT